MRARYLIAFVLLAVTGALVRERADGQSASLRDRIAKLRSDNSPLNAENYGERVQTIRDWGDELTARGLFLTQQDLNLSIARQQTPAPQSARTIRNWIRVLSFLEENGGRLGTLARTDNSQLMAGHYGTFTLEYTVGDVPIPTGGSLRLGQNFFNNRPRLQATEAANENYVTFTVQSRTAKGEVAPAPWLTMYSSIFAALPVPGWKLTSGTLEKGDKVRITVGDRSGGSAGYKAGWRDAEALQFVLAIDFAGNGAVVPVAVTGIPIAGDGAAVLNAVVPSVVAVNEPFSVRVRVEDQFWNPATFEGGAFRVSLNGKQLGELKIPKGQYTGRMDGMRIGAEGGYKVEVSGVDGRLRATSNPILVERQPQQRIYWGELHGHSALDEGTGSAPRYYEFARDVAFLDFGSLTGHDLFMSKAGWDTVRTETERANRAGQFVAYMGYEWTQNSTLGGHHNVFFKTDKGRYVTRWEAPRPADLYQKLRAIDGVDNVLIIPHAHQPGDWNFNDPQMERLIEIFSMHGSFEYFGQRYLKRGYRVGMIAASDDHTGHPGYSPAIISTRNGLAAVYAPKLDRDSIWAGMKNRATYATSNATRPVVRLAVNGKRPGDAVPTGAVPRFEARVLGTHAIDHIDIIRNGAVEYRRDYLTPRPSDPAAVQIMFHTGTETAGDEVLSPKGGVGWGGWIEVSGGRIAGIEPLNVDHITDEFHQVDDRRVWFSCRTRGDFDGVLIKFTEAPADAQVRVIVSELTGTAGGTGAAGYVNRPPGPPSRVPLHEITVPIRQMVNEKAEHKIGDNAFVYARRVRANGPWDVTFTYQPTASPKQDDYFYLRVVQVDGEAAWVSPIWIGEK